MADGRLLWRVLDNLLGNVVKYALPGTRVYVTAFRRGELVVIAVKNISRDALNIDGRRAHGALRPRRRRPPQRGQRPGGSTSPRASPSSSTASSALTVDGDLFKAEIVLPCVKTPEKLLPEA